MARTCTLLGGSLFEVQSQACYDQNDSLSLTFTLPDSVGIGPNVEDLRLELQTTIAYHWARYTNIIKVQTF